MLDLCFFSPLLSALSFVLLLAAVLVLSFLPSFHRCPSTPPDPTGYQSQAEKHLRQHPTALHLAAVHFPTIHRYLRDFCSVRVSFRVSTTLTLPAPPDRFDPLPARIPISDGDIAIWISTLHTIPPLTPLISLVCQPPPAAIGRSAFPSEVSCACCVGWARSVGNQTETRRLPGAKGGILDELDL